MWRRVDAIRLVLLLISIASLWFVVYAQSDIEGPCNTCPAECVGRQNRRRWWTTMWGFIATLIVLTVDVWGLAKAFTGSTKLNVLTTFVLSALNPLFIVCDMLEPALDAMVIVESLRNALGHELVTPLYPWCKSHIKIIIASNVVVNLSPDVYKEVSNQLNAFDNVKLKDFSEALVIGRRVENSKLYNVRLSTHGKLALLRSNVLPPYDELKFIRGNSSIGMAIIATQAIGYIYGIIVRCVQGLRVSPIEAIAGLLNIISLIKVVLHNFAGLGHRPLLLYLLPEEESKFISECENVKGFEFKIENRFMLGILITIASISGLVTYFIINFLKFLNTLCIVPIIIFEASFILTGPYLFYVRHKYVMLLSIATILIVMLNLIGYVWAIVVTFKYWEEEKFDVQSSNYLSQILPYIG